jgi:hypothetical protein
LLGSISAQTRKEEKAARKAALEQQVCNLVESGTFAISFDRANPARECQGPCPRIMK